MNCGRTTPYVTGCGLIAVVTGGLVLIGWAADILRLKSVAPNLVAMNPVTAISFGLIGFSLLLLRTPASRRSAVAAAHAAAMVVIVAGSLRLASDLLHLELQVDRLLFAGSLDDNRMAPNTAICFLLSGLSIVLLDVVTRRGIWLAQIPALLVSMISLVSLVGYGYGAESLYHIAHIPMALHTAVVFQVLSVGILLSRPERGVMAILLDDGAGGVMARRLLPAVIGIPCLLGWVRILGQRMDLYDTEFGAALMVAMTVMLLLLVTGRIAAALNKSDQARQETIFELRQSERTIRRLNEELEQRVQERMKALAVANSDLVQKNRENEFFVYSVSHDLRSPLVNLQGFSKELSEVSQSLRELFVSASLPADVEQRGLSLVDEDMHRCIRFIQTAVSRLSSIIDALLRLSRAGRIEYQLQAVDVGLAVDRIVESMSATISDCGASIEASELPPVWGDSTAVEQVFANLIGNAVNYLDPNRPGRIEIGCQEAPQEDGRRWNTYYVKDNGLGIPAAYHNKIFQALKRLHPEVAKGEGMGLAMVRQIVERHGGTIRFESTAGVGSTFFVTLPGAEANRQWHPAGHSSNHERSAGYDSRSTANLVG